MSSGIFQSDVSNHDLLGPFREGADMHGAGHTDGQPTTSRHTPRHLGPRASRAARIISWCKGLGLIAFIFFAVKGLVWLGVAAAMSFGLLARLG